MVQGKGPLESVRGDVALQKHRAGIIGQHINAWQARAKAVGQVAYRVLLREVGNLPRNGPFGGARAGDHPEIAHNRPRSGGGFCLVSAHHHHRRTSGGVGANGGLPDTIAGTGHDNGLSRKRGCGGAVHYGSVRVRSRRGDGDLRTTIQPRREFADRTN